MVVRLFFLLTLFLYQKKLFSQVKFDSTKCLNLYENDIEAASKDTCMVSLALDCSSESKSDKCVISGNLSKVVNLYALYIQTNKIVEISKANFQFKYLWEFGIKGIITEKTIPNIFLTCRLLNVVNLIYKNPIVKLPSAVMARKASENVCNLIIYGDEKYLNNSPKFSIDLRKLILDRRYGSIDIYHCHFKENEINVLVELANTNKIKLRFL